MAAYIGELVDKIALVNDITNKIKRAIDATLVGTNGTTLAINQATIVQVLRACNVQVYDDGGYYGDANLCQASGAAVYLNSQVPGSFGAFTNPSATDITQTNVVASDVVNAVRNWLVAYSYARKISISDNAVSNKYTALYGVMRTTSATVWAGTIQNAVNSRASTAGITAGALLRATNINSFIDGCFDVWKQYCFDNTYPTYANICHGNHCNHSNHGSRGRR